MISFLDVVAQVLDASDDVLGVLADVVNRGRMPAHELPRDALDKAERLGLLAFLFEHVEYHSVDVWVYPSPLGLRIFAFLERAAEREDMVDARVQR